MGIQLVHVDYNQGLLVDPPFASNFNATTTRDFGTHWILHEIYVWICTNYCAPRTNIKEEMQVQMDGRVAISVRDIEEKIHIYHDPNVSWLEQIISCPHGCTENSTISCMTQPREDEIDHPIVFASKKLSLMEQNYTTIECEGLVMVYALQKFRHYLTGSHFKLYTDHYVLRYLVNKIVLGEGYVDGYCCSNSMTSK